MKEVSIIGLDLAKNVFQAHGAAADGSVVFRRKLSRAQLLKFFAAQPPCLVAMEACASAHHWARDDRRPGAHRQADPAGLREALREAAEERRRGCRGDRRGGGAADDAVRGAEVRGAAGGGDGVPDPGPAGASAHADDQRAARASRRIWCGGADRRRACRPSRRCRRRAKTADCRRR